MADPNILNQCTPRLISVDNSCGCTLTRASVNAMTPDVFAAQGSTEYGMDKIIANTVEARLTGVPERRLTDLFLSRTTPVKTQKIMNDSVIAPFILKPQRSNINANYFVIQSGVVDPNAGVGVLPASTWDLTVINESSQFASPLVSLEKYFLPGRYLTAIYADVTTGVGYNVQFRVISSTNADAGGVSKALLQVVPNVTDATWAGYNAAQKAPYQPTHGLLVPLANSVSNYESWCYNGPSNIPLKLIAFWLQTMRRTFCYNDEYVKAIKAPMTTEFWKKFKTLDLAKQRRQQEIEAEAARWNSIFYGQQINENQTINGYTNLPQVMDPANPNCLLEYKANTLGFRTLLANCGKVTDWQGSALNLDTIKALLYYLKRNREIDSGTVDTIDIMTDRFTAHNILTVMIAYYKAVYGVETNRFYKVGEALKFENQVLWNYNVFEFPDEAVQMAIFTDPYFDDYLAAVSSTGTAADANRGRVLWMLDWSDVFVGLAGTASATRQTNIYDNLYNCVITPNVNHYELFSETIGAMIEDPQRHALQENFSNACPIITANPCVPIS